MSTKLRNPRQFENQSCLCTREQHQNTDIDSVARPLPNLDHPALGDCCLLLWVCTVCLLMFAPPIWCPTLWQHHCTWGNLGCGFTLCDSLNICLGVWPSLGGCSTIHFSRISRCCWENCCMNTSFRTSRGNQYLEPFWVSFCWSSAALDLPSGRTNGRAWSVSVVLCPLLCWKCSHTSCGPLDQTEGLLRNHLGWWKHRVAQKAAAHWNTTSIE